MTNLLFAPPALGTVLSLTGLPGGSNKVHDRSPYGNSGTIVGATWVRLPSGLWYLDFDGVDDKVDCGDKTNLEITTEDFSLLAWIYCTDYTGDHRTIIGGSGLDAVHWQVRKTSGAIVIAKPSAALATAADTAMPTDTWVMLGLVFNSHQTTDNLQYYLNGNTDGLVSFNYDFSGALRYVGRGNNGNSWAFAGAIALPRIFKGIMLSALDFKNIYDWEKHLFGV